MFDLGGLVVLAMFASLGAVRGALASFVRLACPIGAYLVAGFAGPLAGPEVAGRLGLPQLAGSLLAGAAAFAAAWLVLGLLATMILWSVRRHDSGFPPTLRSRMLGAVWGSARGALIVGLCALLFAQADAFLRLMPGLPFTLPDSQQSRLVRISQSSARWMAGGAIDPANSLGRIATQMLASPVQTVDTLQKLLHSHAIEKLQRDEMFWGYVKRGEVNAALDQSSFLGLAEDNDLRAELAAIGAVSPAGRWDPHSFRNSAKKTLEQIGPQLRAIESDPAIARLARDPEIRQALDSGDTISLVRRPEIRALLGRTLRRIEGTATP